MKKNPNHKDVVRATYVSKEICADLKRYGLFGTYEWKVPQKILKSKNKKIKAMFLKGFFDSEGSVDKCSVTIGALNNNGGLDGVKQLLQDLGIRSTIGMKHIPILRVTSRHYMNLFLNKVGFSIKRKQEKLENNINNMKKWCRKDGSYEKVVNLRKMFGWSDLRIYKELEKQGIHIPFGTVSKWTYGYNSPYGIELSGKYQNNYTKRGEII